MHCLMFAFSAPGDSPPPPQRNPHRIGSDIHRDVVKTQTAINDIRDMMKAQEGAGYQPQLVSVTRILSIAEYTLTVA